MRNQSGIWLSITSSLLVMSLNACSNEGAYIPDIYDRAVAVTVSWGNPATEPTSVYVQALATIDSDKGDHSWGGEIVTKMEIDFGDGSGWTDATSYYHDGSRLKHTFPAAGTYYVNARATYWDGEIVPLGSVAMPEPPKAVTVPWPYDYPWHEP